VEEDALHWSTDIMAVRCVEKMLDVLAGGRQAGKCGWWAGQQGLA